MSPLIGLHTILGILIAWAFHLNKFVTLVGVFVTNPWTIVPIYTFGTWIGAKIIGMNDIIPDIEWSRISFRELFDTFRHLLLPFIVGTTVIGIVSAISSYFIIFKAIKKSRE